MKVTERKCFWPGLYREDSAGLHLIASQCKKCGKVVYPTAEVCRVCGSVDLEHYELKQTGRLSSFTITRVQVGKWSPPHYLGQIEFPEVELRIIAPLVPNECYEIGEQVEIVPSKYWDNGAEEVWGYKYRHCGGDNR